MLLAIALQVGTVGSRWTNGTAGLPRLPGPGLGTALLTLPNGVQHTFVDRGKTGANNTAVLSLTGASTDPAARSIRIKTTITPLEGGWARLESFSGRGYGQTIGW